MPNRLPALTGAGMQLDESLELQKQQLTFIYKPKDARKIQGLDPVFTLDDLRRTGMVGSREVKSSLAYPGLSPNFLNEPLDGDSDDEGDDFDGGFSDGRSTSDAGKGHGGRGPPRSPSPEQGGTGRLDPLRYSATSAARSTLLHEKPAVVERMGKGVAACAVLRDNRRFRLFSLGVFQPAVNDVRTRSMHRVELHKHLSSTNLRAPQPDKEVRSAVHLDTVGARLERMYNRVLRSGPDGDASAPPSPPLGGIGGHGGPGAAVGGGGGGNGGRRLSPPGMVLASGGGGGIGMGRSGSVRRLDLEARSAQGQGQGSEPSTQRPSTLTRGTSILQRSSGNAPVSAGGSAGPGPGSGAGGGGARMLLSIPSIGRNGTGPAGQPPPPPQPPGSPTNGGGGSGGNTQRTAHTSDYWMRVTLPPEVIEAQLRHLAASTEANLKAYHDKVAAAQDELLRSNGLGTEALEVGPEAMEQRLKIKLGQIKEDSTVNNFNYSSLGREAVLASQLGPASKQLLTATTLPQFIRAALDHVSQHSGELATLRAAHPHPEEGRRRSIHRRPRAKTSTAFVTALGPLPPPGGADAADSSRTLLSELTANSDGVAAGASAVHASSGGTQDDSTTESGVWPSYLAVRQRAGSAGPPGAAAAAAGQTRASDDDQLDHLRRHASPDSAAREPRWSPPPPLLMGNVRAHTAPAPVLVAAPAPGAAAAAAAAVVSRRWGTFVDDAWMERFRSELLAVESSAPDGPPEGLAPLPPLPPGSMDAGAYVRCRLERLWGLLDVPPPQQLDLVLAFTGRDRALQFARNLELWEQAAVAVLGREAQVEALVSAQREIEAGRAEMLSLAALSGLCVRVLRQTRWVEELSARLRSACGWPLSYHGKPYPGAEAITPTHLLAFMEQLRQVTQITGLKP